MSISAHDLKELQTITASELLAVARKGNLIYINDHYISLNTFRDFIKKTGDKKVLLINSISERNSVSKSIYCSFNNLFSAQDTFNVQEAEETDLTFFVKINDVKTYSELISEIENIKYSVNETNGEGIRFNFKGNEITEEQRIYIKNLFEKYL